MGAQKGMPRPREIPPDEFRCEAYTMKSGRCTARWLPRAEREGRKVCRGHLKSRDCFFEMHEDTTPSASEQIRDAKILGAREENAAIFALCLVQIAEASGSAAEALKRLAGSIRDRQDELRNNGGHHGTDTAET